MKYAPRDYVKAFLSLLEEHPDRETEIVEGLVRMLALQGDLSRADEVVSLVEDVFAEREGRTRLTVRSARPLSSELLKKIREGFGKDALVANRVVPDLLGGVQIVVNGETMIDASLKRKMNALFGSARQSK